MNDNKTSPSYYQKGGMECRDAIRAATSNLTGEEAYNVGCAIKYLWRFKEKNGVDDLRKARQYLDFLIEPRNAHSIIIGKLEQHFKNTHPGTFPPSKETLKAALDNWGIQPPVDAKARLEQQISHPGYKRPGDP